MSEVHNNDIRELLDVIPVIPHNLMMEYLTQTRPVKSSTTPAVKAQTAARHVM